MQNEAKRNISSILNLKKHKLFNGLKRCLMYVNSLNLYSVRAFIEKHYSFDKKTP